MAEKPNIDLFDKIGKWQKMKVINEGAICKYLNGNTKIVGCDVLGEYQVIQGIILYLDNGKDYISAIEIGGDELGEFININVAKIDKKELNI